MKENKPTNGWDVLDEHMSKIIWAILIIGFIICEYHGYEYTFTPMDDTWTGFTARPVDISGVV